MPDRNVETIEKIMQLKAQKKAIILAHNYQRGEVQEIADFIGDSLELSRNAAKTDAAVIVFCGVHFMAETASILCPDKTVLLAAGEAGCPMADMITAAQLRERKKELPGVPVVCYVNTPAEVKAESDICCTSSNAIKIVQSVPAPEILFVPDQYLGHYVSTNTDKKLFFWPGYCPTHAKIFAEDILKCKSAYPEAKVLVHPECRPEVIALADAALSTSGMVTYVKNSAAKELIIGTDIAILYRLQKENPEKKFIHASKKAVCPNMKLTTLGKVLKCLEEMAPQVKVPEEIRIKAKSAVDKMLATP